ncbi:MAG: hypothetical protein PUB94_05915 [Oscillospiraceae bacterium]|nr:hypothetical protein [Oscillospiraceae bacterium]
MQCDDFSYNGECASEHGFMAIIPNDDNANTFALSRELIKTELSQERNETYLYGTKYVEPLSLHFLLIKNIDKNITQKSMEITRSELGSVQAWLTSPKVNKKLTTTIDNETKEYYGIFTEVTPYDYDGLYGINLTFTCNSPYGYIVHETTVESPNTNIVINNETDELYEYTYPTIKITPRETGTFSVKNITDNDQVMNITVKSSGENYPALYIDCKNCIILSDGKTESLDVLGFENIIDWNNVENGAYKIYWLRLLPGENTLSFSGNGTFEITFRAPSKTGVY